MISTQRTAGTGFSPSFRKTQKPDEGLEGQQGVTKGGNPFEAESDQFDNGGVKQGPLSSASSESGDGVQKPKSWLGKIMAPIGRDIWKIKPGDHFVVEKTIINKLWKYAPGIALGVGIGYGVFAVIAHHAAIAATVGGFFASHPWMYGVVAAVGFAVILLVAAQVWDWAKARHARTYQQQMDELTPQLLGEGHAVGTKDGQKQAWEHIGSVLEQLRDPRLSSADKKAIREQAALAASEHGVVLNGFGTLSGRRRSDAQSDISED